MGSEGGDEDCAVVSLPAWKLIGAPGGGRPGGGLLGGAEGVVREGEREAAAPDCLLVEGTCCCRLPGPVTGASEAPDPNSLVAGPSRPLSPMGVNSPEVETSSELTGSSFSVILCRFRVLLI